MGTTASGRAPTHCDDQVKQWLEAAVLPHLEVRMIEREQQLAALLALDQDRIE